MVCLHFSDTPEGPGEGSEGGGRVKPSLMGNEGQEERESDKALPRKAGVGVVDEWPEGGVGDCQARLHQRKVTTLWTQLKSDFRPLGFHLNLNSSQPNFPFAMQKSRAPRQTFYWRHHTLPPPRTLHLLWQNTDGCPSRCPPPVLISPR